LTKSKPPDFIRLMMNHLLVTPTAQLALYCLLVALASLAGGWILLAVRLTHLRLQLAGSFVAGLMLSMALLHFIPHAVHQNHSLDRTRQLVLSGFLAMFLLQRFFPHHHHDVSEEAPERTAADSITKAAPTLAVA
jgi:zinc and cadmium transporter